MSNQQITTEDGGAYGIPSGQRRLRDGHAFFLCGDWYFMADGEPVKLETARNISLNSLSAAGHMAT
jgi:hypothetical protein